MSTPIDDIELTLRIEAGGPTTFFQDTSRTTPAGVGDFVASGFDAATNLALEQGTSGKRVTLQEDELGRFLRFDYTRQDFLSQTFDFALADGDYWIKYRLISPAPDQYLAVCGGHALGTADDSGPNGFGHGYTNWNTGSGSPTASNVNCGTHLVFQTHHVKMRGGVITGHINGVPTRTWTGTTGTAAEIILGGRYTPGVYSGRCEVSAFILANGISDEDAARIDDYLGGTDLPRIIGTGDSLVDNSLADLGVNPGQEWLSQLQVIRGTGEVLINDGIWGQVISEMIARHAQTNAMLRTGDRSVFLGGSNNLKNGQSSATVLAAINTWVSGAAIAPYVMTIPPRDDYDGAMEANRLTLNASLRSGGVTGIAGIIDLADDSRIIAKTGLAGDGVHWTAAGYAIFAEIVNAAIPAPSNNTAILGGFFF